MPMSHSPIPKTSILGVYSAIGRSGKSTVAANLALGLSQQGFRPFYLSLEDVVTFDLFPSVDEGKAYRQLLYYFKTNESQARSKLTAAVHTDARTRVDYFDQSIPDVDSYCETLTVQELKLTLGWLQSTERYTHIILDLDSKGGSENWDRLGLCDQLIWLLLDDRIYIRKSAMIHRQWSEYASSKKYSVQPVYVLNKFRGRQENNINELGFSIGMQLPYIPKWKSITQSQELLQEKLFREQLMLGLRKQAKGGSG